MNTTRSRQAYADIDQEQDAMKSLLPNLTRSASPNIHETTIQQEQTALKLEHEASQLVFNHPHYRNSRYALRTSL